MTSSEIEWFDRLLRLKNHSSIDASAKLSQLNDWFSEQRPGRRKHKVFHNIKIKLDIYFTEERTLLRSINFIKQIDCLFLLIVLVIISLKAFAVPGWHSGRRRRVLGGPSPRRPPGRCCRHRPSRPWSATCGGLRKHFFASFRWFSLIFIIASPWILLRFDLISLKLSWNLLGFPRFHWMQPWGWVQPPDGKAVLSVLLLSTSAQLPRGVPRRLGTCSKRVVEVFWNEKRVETRWNLKKSEEI